jgi:hypothetical protein
MSDVRPFAGLATAWIARLLLAVVLGCTTIHWGFATIPDLGARSGEQAVSEQLPQLAAQAPEQVSIRANQPAKPEPAGGGLDHGLLIAAATDPFPLEARVREAPIRAPPPVGLPAPRPETRAPPPPT